MSAMGPRREGAKARSVNAGAGLLANQPAHERRFAGKPAPTATELLRASDQITPWASIASATLTKPATLAPSA